MTLKTKAPIYRANKTINKCVKVFHINKLVKSGKIIKTKISLPSNNYITIYLEIKWHAYKVKF